MPRPCGPIFEPRRKCVQEEQPPPFLLNAKLYQANSLPSGKLTRRSEPGWWHPDQPGCFRPADRSPGERGCQPSSRNQSGRSQPGQTEPAKYASCHSLYGKHGKDHVAGDPPGGYCPALKCRAAWRPHYSRHGQKIFGNRQMAPIRPGNVSPIAASNQAASVCVPPRMAPPVRTTGMANRRQAAFAPIAQSFPSNRLYGFSHAVRLHRMCRRPANQEWGNATSARPENVSRRPTFRE